MHLRYGDDCLLFTKKLSAYDDLLKEIDKQLSEQSLTRSIDKTETYEDPEEAAASLRSGRLASLGDLLNENAPAGISAVRRDFDELLNSSDPEQFKFRWLVKTLANIGDSYGCIPLAKNPAFMNVDPRASANYLIAAGLEDRKVTDAFMNRLASRAEENYDALDLHLLRTAANVELGEVEAKEFRRIAMDSSRRWPIRNWAWKAYVRDASRAAETMEAARDEQDPRVRRGMVLSLGKLSSPEFLHHARQNFPECKYAVEWLEAA